MQVERVEVAKPGENALVCLSARKEYGKKGAEGFLQGQDKRE